MYVCLLCIFYTSQYCFKAFPMFFYAFSILFHAFPILFKVFDAFQYFSIPCPCRGRSSGSAQVPQLGTSRVKITPLTSSFSQPSNPAAPRVWLRTSANSSTVAGCHCLCATCSTLASAASSLHAVARSTIPSSGYQWYAHSPLISFSSKVSKESTT